MNGFYWSMNCRDCFSCKQKKFNYYHEMVEWLIKKERTPRRGWEKIFDKKGFLILYWCSQIKSHRPKALKPGIGQTRTNKFCQHIDN